MRAILPCVAVLLGTTGPARHHAAAAPPTPPPRLDRFGDPLPRGAVARLGTARWCMDRDGGLMRYAPDGSVALVFQSGLSDVGRPHLLLFDARDGRPLW